MSFLEDDPALQERSNRRFRRCIMLGVTWVMFLFIAALYLKNNFNDNMMINTYVSDGLSAMAALFALVIGWKLWLHYEHTVRLYREDYELSEHAFADLKKICKLLNVKKQTLNQFFRVFAKIDEDVSNYISISEYLDYFPLENTFFTRKAFSLFDAENTGRMHFVEFIITTYAFCTLDYDAMITYVFRLFDTNHNDELDHDELYNMLTLIHGKMPDDRLNLVLERLEEEHSGAVSYEMLHNFCKKYPVLLCPCFFMQHTIQKKVINEKFWVANATPMVQDHILSADFIRLLEKKHERNENYNEYIAQFKRQQPQETATSSKVIPTNEDHDAEQQTKTAGEASKTPKRGLGFGKGRKAARLARAEAEATAEQAKEQAKRDRSHFPVPHTLKQVFDLLGLHLVIKAAYRKHVRAGGRAIRGRDEDAALALVTSGQHSILDDHALSDGATVVKVKREALRQARAQRHAGYQTSYEMLYQQRYEKAWAHTLASLKAEKADREARQAGQQAGQGEQGGVGSAAGMAGMFGSSPVERGAEGGAEGVGLGSPSQEAAIVGGWGVGGDGAGDGGSGMAAAETVELDSSGSAPRGLLSPGGSAKKKKKGRSDSEDAAAKVARKKQERVEAKAREKAEKEVEAREMKKRIDLEGHVRCLTVEELLAAQRESKQKQKQEAHWNSSDYLQAQRRRIEYYSGRLAHNKRDRDPGSIEDSGGTYTC